jgi:hypothetical protein
VALAYSPRHEERGVTVMVYTGDGSGGEQASSGYVSCYLGWLGGWVIFLENSASSVVLGEQTIIKLYTDDTSFPTDRLPSAPVHALLSSCADL